MFGYNVTRLQEMEMEELDELFFILGVEPGGVNFETGEIPEEVKNRFTINDLDQLNWAFRKLSAFAGKKADVKRVAEAEAKRISDWLALETKSIDDNVKFFEYMVNDYAQRRRAADEKYKGDKTPYGKISFTKQQPEWTYPSEAETVAFLEQDEALAVHVKVEKTIANKTEIKKALEIKRNVFVRGGEVVDVAQATPGGWIGMQYMERVTEETAAEIVDMSTGEVAQGVELRGTVVVANGVKIVPGVSVADRPDKIGVKAE